MADAPKTTTVEALQWHTYNGKEYNIGDTYQIDDALVDSVTTQGKAVRTDRVAHAKRQAAAADAVPAKGRARKNKMLKVQKTSKSAKKK